MQIINPLTHPGYDELVLDMGGSFFHSSHWAKVLHESYGYKPVYFASLNDKVLIPFMEIKSSFTGKRGVSLPFTDYCTPIIPDGANIKGIMDDVIQFGKSAGWKYVEIRSGDSLPNEFTPSSFFYRHVLDITKGEATIFSDFSRYTKKNINRAKGEGVTVTISNSLEAVKAFYVLQCMTRKNHGLPPQPFRFFDDVHEHILSKGHGIVALAEFGGATVAGSVFFHFGDKVIDKYGASDKKYQHIRPNNIIIWEVIRYCAARGYKSLCFGRTEPENNGLLLFKRGWGTQEQSINYYKYDLTKNAFVKDSSKLQGFHNKIFCRLPMPLLRLSGSLLYRHMG